MISPVKRSLLAVGFVAMLLPTSAAALDEQEKQEIGAFIREYLVENPEILIEAQQALEAKRMAERQQQAVAVIEEEQEALLGAENDIIVGNPNGAVTIIEFFDYNCGYCKQAHADMNAIVATDDDVRFVLKEWPVLGEDSLAAHRISLAFGQIAPAKHAQFHDALLTSRRADEDSAVAIAEQLGVSRAQLAEAVNAPMVEETIRENYRLADALGMSGTPSYVIGKETVFGAMGAEFLLAKIDNMKACGETVC